MTTGGGVGAGRRSVGLTPPPRPSPRSDSGRRVGTGGHRESQRDSVDLVTIPLDLYFVLSVPSGPVTRGPLISFLLGLFLQTPFSFLRGRGGVLLFVPLPRSRRRLLWSESGVVPEGLSLSRFYDLIRPILSRKI